MAHVEAILVHGLVERAVRDGHVRRARAKDGGAVPTDGDDHRRSLGASPKVGGFEMRWNKRGNRRCFRSRNLHGKGDAWTRQATSLGTFLRVRKKTELNHSRIGADDPFANLDVRERITRNGLFHHTSTPTRQSVAQWWKPTRCELRGSFDRVVVSSVAIGKSMHWV